MSVVNEIPLPGIGVRYEFVTHDGDRVAVVHHRSGYRHRPAEDDHHQHHLDGCDWCHRCRQRYGGADGLTPLTISRSAARVSEACRPQIESAKRSGSTAVQRRRAERAAPPSGSTPGRPSLGVTGGLGRAASTMPENDTGAFSKSGTSTS